VALLIALLFPTVQQSGFGEASRYQCKHNLKMIGLALHNYHDRYGCFPPVCIRDKTGRPLHSWRVLLLPFLDQQTLYNEYRFDEPWDGPHNTRLASRVGAIFNCATENRRHNRKQTPMTSYVAVVGPGTMWPADRPVSLEDVTDDLSSTLMVVEIANSTISWMEPRDLPLSQLAPRINGQPGPAISSVHRKCVQCLFADGSTRLLLETLPATTLSGLLTRNGGEPVSDF
jgi:hypothetical protein